MIRRTGFLLPFFLLGLLPSGTAFGADLDALRQRAGLLALRQPVPIVDFELQDLSGKTVKLSSYTGRVFLLNFWATWCGPCREEIPTMVRLRERLRSEGFEIVAISVMEDAATVRPFVTQARMDFPVLLDTHGEAAGTYGAVAIPTTYVVDRQGRAIAGVNGAITWSTPAMEEYLRALVAQGN
jgi:peroxiredoxin